MHRSLKLLAALSLGALVMAAPVRAEEGGAKPEGGKKEKAEGKKGGGPGAGLSQVLDQLDLTAEQKKTIQPIVQESQTEMQKVMSDQTIPQDQKRTKIREIRQATMAKIDPTLTPEQKEKLKNVRQEAQKKRDGEGGGKKGAKDGAKKDKN